MAASTDLLVKELRPALWLDVSACAQCFLSGNAVPRRKHVMHGSSHVESMR